MDLRLLLLSLTTFAAGVAESVLIGILPPLASDLRVSVSLAGQLTALFSVAFAVAVPLVTWLTRRWERRRLLVAALLVFALFNVLPHSARTTPVCFWHVSAWPPAADC